MSEIDENVKAKLLIVDDEIIVAEDLKGRLGDLVYEVTAVAGTGRDAIVRAEETRPDLILMNI